MGRFAEKLGEVRTRGSATFLAPMAGVSDLGMRQAAARHGATFVVSEMVSSAFLLAGDGGNRLRASGDGLDCHIVQIASCNPETLAASARYAEEHGADAIDINMGCPAKKVVGGLAGSALMRDLDQATRLIRATVAAASVPVTVKMRLGWDDSCRNAPELARRAELEGVALVTVHGRTRCQFYKGQADWMAIRAVVDAVNIPVVANGDCASIEDASEMIACSGAAAVMIGRAAIGRPWLVGDIAHALATGERRSPTRAERLQCALVHYATILSQFGREQGVRYARKHLAGYAAHAGQPSGSHLHHRLVTENDPDEIIRLLPEIFDGGEMAMAA